MGKGTQGQSRLESLVETLLNTAIGFVVALVSQWLIFPFFGIHVGLSENLQIGFWFTLVSIARGYILRRYFNGRLKKAAAKLAALGTTHEQHEAAQDQR